MNENEIGSQVIHLAIQIHRDLGPGLFESVYDTILYQELIEFGFHVERQVNIPIVYHGVKYDKAFRADLIIENKVLVEIKATEANTSIHKKQLYTYLKLSNLKLGYLLNFNALLLKDGITRIINGYL